MGSREYDTSRRFPAISRRRCCPRGRWPAQLARARILSYWRTWLDLAQARVLGDTLVAGESACVELQVKSYSAKKTTGSQIMLGQHLHLPLLAHGYGKKPSPPLQISDTTASIAFVTPTTLPIPEQRRRTKARQL
ncbi:hypothetical protein EI94DRAFT_1732945 [Lactarius quietus]|nr:hypothetical protein EI94DRAFT_1732945 [Lactarius quietus]